MKIIDNKIKGLLIEFEKAQRSNKYISQNRIKMKLEFLKELKAEYLIDESLRYFLIIYKNKHNELENAVIENKTFPNLITIEKMLSDNKGISNIIEFKNKEDYDNFIA